MVFMKFNLNPKDSRFGFMIKLLEDRLHQNVLRTNQASFDSRQLKGENELLDKEARIYKTLMGKLEMELKAVVDSNFRLAAEAASNNTAADSALKQMSHLDSQINRERDEFKKELTELNRLIENDRKMREFIVQREMLKTAEQDKLALNAREIRPTTATITPVDKARLEELTEFFAAIRFASGIVSIEKLIGYFTEKEMVNYSHFTKVNIDREETERVTRRNEEMSRQIQEIRSSIASTHERRDAAPVSDPSAAVILQSEKLSEEFGVKSASISKLLASLRLLLQPIFHKVFDSCDPLGYISPSILAASFGSTGIPIGTVTEGNLLAYLSAIESRTDEIVGEYCRELAEDPTGGDKMRGARKKSAPNTLSLVNGRMLQFKLPSAADDNESEEGDARDGNENNTTNRPFTRNELKIRTLHSIQKAQDKLKAKRANLKYVA